MTDHPTNSGSLMRGHVDSQDMLVSYVSPESRGPAAHPLRRITAVAEPGAAWRCRPSLRRTTPWVPLYPTRAVAEV